MSAIIPHLEHPEDTTRIEKQFYRCVAGEPVSGSGHFADASVCPSPQEIVARDHQELLAMVYVRNAVEQALAGRAFTVQNGHLDSHGKWIDTQRVYLSLDYPIGDGASWNPNASPLARHFSLLAWTSKMNAPSFSIPAGAPDLHGACPGAAAGQSLVPADTMVRAQRFVREVTGQTVKLSLSICETCYALGGQYSTGNVQYAQALRYIWARQAILEPAVGPGGRPSTLFIETMVAAISGANFFLDGGRISKEDLGDDDEPKGEARLPPEASGRRFFRLHDSGDFFSPEYLRQWKLVCERLPDITFWAPSRVWAAGGDWIDIVNRVNAPQQGSANNLVIRPSAYLIDGPAPANLGPGWAAGSTVVSFEDDGGPPAAVVAYVEGLEGKPMKMLGTNRPDPRYDWSCRAYSTGSTHTCRNAVAPPGRGGADGKGCRACWDVPQAIVNYHPH